jgi:hypothetical protein
VFGGGDSTAGTSRAPEGGLLCGRGYPRTEEQLGLIFSIPKGFDKIDFACFYVEKDAKLFIDLAYRLKVIELVRLDYNGL